MLIFSSGRQLLSTIKALLDELNLMMPQGLLYSLANPYYLSRYLLGMLASSTRSRTQKVEWLKPPKTDDTEVRVKFLLSDTSLDIKVCLNIVESHTKFDFDILQSMFIGDKIVHESSLQSDDVIVFNIISGFQHNSADFVDPSQAWYDYVKKGVTVRKIPLDVLLAQSGDREPIPEIQLRKTLQEIIDRKIVLEFLRVRFNDFFLKFEPLVKSGLEMSSFGTGLLHYTKTSQNPPFSVRKKPTMRNTISVTIDQRESPVRRHLLFLTINFSINGEMQDEGKIVGSADHLGFNVEYQPKTTTRAGYASVYFEGNAMVPAYINVLPFLVCPT